MRPAPMQPMLMRLLGAYCPNTEDGTIAGNPMAATAPRPVFKKPRRETLFLPISLKVLSSRRRILSPQCDHVTALPGASDFARRNASQTSNADLVLNANFISHGDAEQPDRMQLNHLILASFERIARSIGLYFSSSNRV
jgi:hypothetical protein